jgi:phospholipid/cholesterol/gamma-HCH transport system substrate-binding protein
MAVLVGIIILMSGNSGGLFARKLVLRSYFENASGIKPGAPVTLEGVTIGNVVHIRIVPERGQTPVEVTLRVSHESVYALHTDSTVSIAQAGALGDSFLDINSVGATGPPPANNAELKAVESPNIQSVIRSSESSMEQITTLMRKVDVLIDTLNSKKGSMGQFINDPAFYNRINRIAADLQTITGAVAGGKGSLGKLMTDDSLYTRANSAIDRVDKITIALDEGKGTAGKLLHDDSLYNNLNTAVSNANQLLAEINAGHGSIGKLARDPDFAKKLDDTVTRLDSILKNVDEGKGSLGQFVTNRSLYDNADQTLDQAHQLVKSMRENPKKYLVVQLKIF